MLDRVTTETTAAGNSLYMEVNRERDGNFWNDRAAVASDLYSVIAAKDKTLSI